MQQPKKKIVDLKGEDMQPVAEEARNVIVNGAKKYSKDDATQLAFAYQITKELYLSLKRVFEENGCQELPV